MKVSADRSSRRAETRGDANFRSLPLVVTMRALLREVDGFIYLIGGQDSSGNILNSVEVYDVDTNQWSQGSTLELPARRQPARRDLTAVST
jgi:hypothetical protein